jgi:lipopolysaccharide/colanic/teichoic acid biosynthesis glycosyltransferase
MNPTRFEASCRDVKSEHRVSGSNLAFGNGILMPTCSAIVRSPHVKSSSKDNDSGWHVELAIRLGLLLKRSMDVVLSTIALIFLWPLMLLIAAQYTSEHCRRLRVKPGTGLWQVLARANPSFEISLILDLAYIEKWSLLLDCRILMKTIPAVLAGRGQ